MYDLYTPRSNKTGAAATVAIERRRFGNVSAMYWLGRIFDGKEKYPADLDKAFGYFLMGAIAGDAESQFSLAVCYLTGRGVLRQPEVGVTWCRAAAKQGHMHAAWELSGCRTTKASASKNARLATHWLRKAASGGVEAAREILEMQTPAGETEAKRLATQ